MSGLSDKDTSGMEGKKQQIFILVLFLFNSFSLFATGNEEKYLLPEDTVYIRIGLFQERIFQHTLEAGQTLFSLSKFYGLSMQELSLLNPGISPATIRPGYRINVRIPLSAILMQQYPPRNRQEYVPVYYVVKKEDTLFKICKYYFNIPQRNLVQMNALTTEKLSLGQKLLLGWMSTEGITEEMKESEESGLLESINAELKFEFDGACMWKDITQQKGPAQWVQGAKSSDELIALHNEAPANSIIKVFNPMNNRTLYVRVMEKIPPTRYDQNIKVVLSPMAAHLLGMKNKKSWVHVSYCR